MQILLSYKMWERWIASWGFISPTPSILTPALKPFFSLSFHKASSVSDFFKNMENGRAGEKDNLNLYNSRGNMKSKRKI